MFGSIPKSLRVIVFRSAVLGAGIVVGSAIAEPADVPATADVQLTLQARNALWDERHWTSSTSA